MTVQLSASLIEALLGMEQYKPVNRMDKKQLKPQQMADVNEMENLVTFGQDSIDLFDTLVNQKQTLPTQAEYVKAGLPLMTKWVRDNRPDIIMNKYKREALVLRMTRTYMSKVIELHLEATIKENMPELKVMTFPLIDSVMGVDLIVEDDKKRYYVHVTSNTPFAQRMLEQKENRGGYRVGKTNIPYSRNFNGDLIFKYDVNAETDSTQVINGFPLFKTEYVSFRFLLAKTSTGFGEDINKTYSKLQHFKDWAKTYLNISI